MIGVTSFGPSPRDPLACTSYADSDISRQSMIPLMIQLSLDLLPKPSATLGFSAIEIGF